MAFDCRAVECVRTAGISRRQALAMLAAAVVVSFAPWSAAYCAFEGWFLAWRKTSLGSFVMMIVVFLLLVVASIRVVNSSYNPFIYFRF
jgi:hypothetical protein